VVAVFVLHAIWFQFGWVHFYPLCFDSTGSIVRDAHRSLIGPMTPEAAIAFADTLDYRDRGVAHVSDENYVVARPAMVLFDDGGVWNNTHKIALKLAEEQGLPAPDFDESNECLEAERVLIVGGRAETHAPGWGTWPWSTFDERSAVVDWLRDQAN